MSNPIFKKSAIASAVAATFVSTGVFAANLSVSKTFPKLQQKVFLGNNNTKVRLTATGGNAEALIQATIHYYDAANNFISSSLAATDSDATTAVVINMTVGIPAGAVKAIITVDQNGATDTVAGGQPSSYIMTNGVINPTGAADQATARTAAEVAGEFHPIDPAYDTITVTDAKVDNTASPKVLYVTFNADPNINPTDTLAANTKVDVKEGLSSTPVIASGEPGITNSLTTNVLAFVDNDAGAKNTPTTTLPNLVAFGAAIASVSNAGGLDDGAGNVPVAPGTIAPVNQLAPPDYAGAGQVVVATSGAPTDLYNDTGVTAISLNIRLDEVVDPATWDEDADIAFSNTVTTGGSFAVTADANGDQTILTLTATRTGANKFFADPATGKILYGATRDTATPFTAQIKKATTNGGVSDLALGLNNSVVIAADLASQGVVVGVVEAPEASTVDSDEDGYIDGVKIDFKQTLNGVGSGANLGLISFMNDSDLQGAEVARPINLATNGPTTTDNTKVTMLLQNPDVPKEDGTAPDTAQNDYNADGKIDKNDAALIIDANVDTAATDVQPGDISGKGDLPFSAEIGINTAAAEKDNSKVETDLTYKFAYNPQTGSNLGVATTRFAAISDGAKPVVKRVEYVQTNDGSATNPDNNGQTRDPSGTVTIVASEALKSSAPNVGEFLFNNKPVSLINLDANVANKAATVDPILGDDDRFEIENVPGSVFGQMLSLGITPNVFDTNDNPLITSQNDQQNTVAAPKAAAPKMVSAEPIHAADSLKWNQVVVMFDQAVEKADPSTNLDGMFIVRARVGAARGAAFENRKPGSDSAYFDFRIKASDVQISGDKVTLTVPIDDFPSDTSEIWVDYQGATPDQIAAGSMDYLKSVDKGTAADVTLADKAGESIFYGEYDADPDPLVQDVINDDIPETVNVINDVDPWDGIAVDADTVNANLPPLFLATHAQDNHRNIFVQTIKGAAKKGDQNLIDGTGVRVDLVRKEADTMSVSFAEAAAVADGLIQVRRGANSDGNTNTPTGTSNQSGAPNNPNSYADNTVGNVTQTNTFGNNTVDLAQVDGTGADQWQTIALRNNGVVTTQMLNDIAQRRKKIADIKARIAALTSENASASAIDKEQRALAKEEDAFKVLYDDLHNPMIWAYIKITTGEGKSSGAANQDVNSNANVGRTATLEKVPSNVLQNGTTSYPVSVFLDDGAVESTGGNGDEISVRNGQLHIKIPVLENKEVTKGYYKVLDTAWTMVENGQYKAVVGMEQDRSSEGLNAKTTKLRQEYNDAFILVSVLDPNTGKWVLTNSAEPSFDSYKPFGADIESNADATRNTHNIDLAKIARVQLYGNQTWETFGIPGEMARNPEKPLDLNRFFITVDEGDGRPVTVWHCDDGGNEMAFTLGLGKADAKKPEVNKVQLLFELGGQGGSPVKTIGAINPAPGAAIAYLGDGTASEENLSEVHNNDTNYSNRGLLDDFRSDNLPLFVPLKVLEIAPDLSVQGWHLVTLQKDQSVKDYAAGNANTDAVIAFVNQDHAIGNNQSSKNITWFLGDTTNDKEINEVLKRGQALFVHIKE